MADRIGFPAFSNPQFFSQSALTADQLVSLPDEVLSSLKCNDRVSLNESGTIAIEGDTDALSSLTDEDLACLTGAAADGAGSDISCLSAAKNGKGGRKAVRTDETSSPSAHSPSRKTAEPETGDTDASADGIDNDELPLQADNSSNLAKISIIHTNDIHGMKEKLPALSTLLGELKRENPKAVIVDAGDIAYSAAPMEEDRFAPIVDFINENGYFAVVPGNHDFQNGKDEVVNNFFSRIKAHVICSNVLDKDTGKPLPHTKPYIIQDIDGVKVAFLGDTTTKMSTNDHPSTGDDLIVFGEVESLQRDVALARSEGAEVFVAAVHKGVNDVKEIKGIAEKVPELDIIISAHDHKLERTSIRTGPAPHRTYIVEAGSYGNFAGGVNLTYDKKAHAVIRGQMKSYPTEKYVIKAPLKEKETA